ncbi:MAG: GMC family oxidoreductase [Bacteroidota bacterium]
MIKNVNIAQEAEEYDAIVVGSGVSGGWAAKELCEKGLKTLVLERGRPIEHGTDYITEHKAPWQFSFRGGAMGRAVREKNPVLARDPGNFNETSAHFYAKDEDQPYLEDAPFTWLRGDQVGGRSLIWGRQCYRWSDIDFAANKVDGHGVDWPIRYNDIAPWYDYVEDYVGICGEALGLPQLPDGKFLKPMELNVVEKHTRAAIEQNFPGRTMTIGRAAILTEARNGRAACHYCGPCHRGCSTSSYFSSNTVTLPAAFATGNLTLRPHSIAHSVIYDENQDKALGVRVIDAETKEVIEFRGKIIFMCASTIGSTQVMLNSKSNRFPDGIANSSGALGKYLMDHHFLVGATGDMLGFEDKYYYGNRPNGAYVPRFRNISPETKHPDFVRGYGFQGSARRSSWQRGNGMRGFGKSFKESLRNPGPWSWWLGAWGEALPREDNYMVLDSNEVDQWGMPLVRINCTWGDNEFAMRKDMGETAAEMLEAAGATNVQIFDAYEDTKDEQGIGAAPGLCIHEMGTARMGRDPQTSVLNAHNQAHDVSNLFVTDGSAMASSACQNPSITYMALTARAVDYAVEEMKKNNL